MSKVLLSLAIIRAREKSGIAADEDCSRTKTREEEEVKRALTSRPCDELDDDARWACGDARCGDRCSESFDDATLREVGAEEPTEVEMVVKEEVIDRRVEEGEDSTRGVWLDDDCDARDSESPEV